MAKLVMLGKAADAIGIPNWRLTNLRSQGLVPEAMQVGRFFVFPEDKLPEIKARLLRDGHIKPSELREVIYAAG